MKKILLPLFVFALTATSCMKNKEATCTCKDSSGNIISTQLIRGTKKEIEQFKTKCKANTTDEKVYGVVISSTPCEVS